MIIQWVEEPLDEIQLEDLPQGAVFGVVYTEGGLIDVVQKGNNFKYWSISKGSSWENNGSWERLVELKSELKVSHRRIS